MMNLIKLYCCHYIHTLILLYGICFFFGRVITARDSFVGLAEITGVMAIHLTLRKCPVRSQDILDELIFYLAALAASSLVYLLDWNTTMVLWPTPSLIAICIVFCLYWLLNWIFPGSLHYATSSSVSKKD
jgi:hypothetical protein